MVGNPHSEKADENSRRVENHKIYKVNVLFMEQ